MKKITALFFCLFPVIIFASNLPNNANANKSTWAYIVDTSMTQVLVCRINNGNGTLSKCQATGSGFESPKAIVINNNGTKAYIANYLDSTVSLCDVSHNNGKLSNCHPTGLHGTGKFDQWFDTAAAIALNPANTRAYIFSAGNGQADALSYECNISSSGELNKCTKRTYPFTAVYGMALNTFGTQAYIAGFSSLDSLVMAPITPYGTLGKIQSTHIRNNIEYYGIAFNSSDTLAYVASDNGVKICHVLSSGALSKCQNQASQAHQTLSITLNASGTRVYTVNYPNGSGSGTVSVCKINSQDGSLSDCQETGAGFVAPKAIAVF